MKVSYVEFLGQKHPLCFSLAASEAILEEFQSLEAMSDAITGEDVAIKVHAIDRVLQILMKAGRIYASACGEDLPPELPCRPADLIPDELEKIRAEIPAGLIEQEEDVLSYAQFGQVAIKFFERRRDKKYGVDADHVDRANKVHPV